MLVICYKYGSLHVLNIVGSPVSAVQVLLYQTPRNDVVQGARRTAFVNLTLGFL